ncbi:MAG: hypothetical protein R3B81_16135 [bacterium]
MLFILLCIGTASATTEVPVAIYQPIYTQDVAIKVLPVPYASRGDVWASPGCMVARTLFENRVGIDGGFENRNAASLAGLRIHLVPHDPPGEGRGRLLPGLFGDTLRIVLSAPEVATAVTIDPRSGVSYPLYPLDEVLPATRACLLLNAWYERRRFRYLEIHLDGGAARYPEFEGVYEVPEERAEP